MTSELVPVSAVELGRVADQRELLRRRAEGYAVRWLHGYTSAKTRNAYAVDLGLSPEVRTALPGGPANPEPVAEWGWIRWALDHGIDPAGNLRRADAEAYAHALSGFPKNVRRRRFGSALCAYYRWLRVEGVVSCDPGELVNRRVMGLSGMDPSPTLPLHPRQVRALYLAARLPARGRARTAALLAVLAATGCRAAELVGINLDDYRLQPEGHALIRLDGKGDKKRWVMLPAPDAAIVAAYLEVRASVRSGREVALPGQVSAASAGEPLFTTAKGERVHVNEVTRTLRTLAGRPSPAHPDEDVREAARVLAPAVRGIHPHQFRHTYTVVAEENGVPVSQIQADLGHASLATTQTYLHARDSAVHSAARVVSGIYHAGQT